MDKIILASQSPRRKQLLEWALIPFDIIVKNTDESYPDGLASEEVPVYIAKQKALAVKQHVREAYHATHLHQAIVAADTVVVLNNQIIGKPKDREEAVQILSALSNQKHKVITGVVILQEDRETAFADTTEVEFNALTQEQIEFYVDEYKPYDKAGAYAIQEWIGVTGIKKINGDFYNVMGLPISRLIQTLQRLNII